MVKLFQRHLGRNRNNRSRVLFFCVQSEWRKVEDDCRRALQLDNNYVKIAPVSITSIHFLKDDISIASAGAADRRRSTSNAEEVPCYRPTPKLSDNEFAELLLDNGQIVMHDHSTPALLIPFSIILLCSISMFSFSDIGL